MKEPERADNTFVEVESKLASTANYQAKMLPLLDSKRLIEKLDRVSSVLEVEFGPSQQVSIVDQYFDDRDRSLAGAGVSLRRRREGERAPELTLKIPDAGDRGGDGTALTRKEVDLTSDQISEFRKRPETLAAVLATHGIDIALGEELVEVLEVRNKRVIVPTKTSVAAYTLNYDKFHFFSPSPYRHSEYFAEVELEAESFWPDVDEQRSRLLQLVEVMLDFKPNRTSKYSRGVQWADSSAPALRTVYSVGFDIVNYSGRDAETQKQMIMRLNTVVKKAVRSFLKAQDPLLHIPIGDGMILVFDGAATEAKHIVPMVAMVQRELRDGNDKLGAQLAFEVRTALHVGPVFSYSDVNGNLNLAGTGINLLARALTQGDAWHVVATEQAFETLGQPYADHKSAFQWLGKIRIKNDELTLYNVHDEVMSLGRPAGPDLK